MHLATPRLIADETQKTVWRWDNQEPFGNDTPNEDPDGDGVAFDLPLRFPGQYFDRETNLAYNMARDYSSEIGRYVESDPIGLAAGLNTYLYVAGDPIRLKDPLGLSTLCAADDPNRPNCEAKLALDMLICKGIEGACLASCAFVCRRSGPLLPSCMALCGKGVCDPVASYCRKGAVTDYAECKRREAAGK